MHYDIKAARHIEGYRVEISFEDGKKGVVDLQGYVKRGGLFSRFADLDYFRNFHINKELGALCWDGGLDIAPEVLYHEATGQPLPAWMKNEPEGKKAV
ncbi:MAG: DUF2442 domain-containing protein [Deltaproteobacteria bacterium]|nr:DUF2442 domain-containing protein [Deltaproteobacteria bacterium]MBZ0220192.1 DUF2442 domain-containing protein [Deltaproteobacteria bacterium]